MKLAAFVAMALKWPQIKTELFVSKTPGMIKSIPRRVSNGHKMETLDVFLNRSVL